MPRSIRMMEGKKDKAMMVTDYPEKDEKKRKLKFEVGAQYYVSGTFVKSSATGFSSSEGLIVYAGAEPVAAAQ